MFVPDAPPPPDAPEQRCTPPDSPPPRRRHIADISHGRATAQRPSPPNAAARSEGAARCPLQTTMRHRLAPTHCTPDSPAEETPYRLMPPPNDDARRRLAAPQGCTRRPPNARNNAAHTPTAPPRRLHIADISRRRRTAPPLRRCSRGRTEPVADDPANGPSVAVKTLTARRSVAPRRRPTSEHTNAVPKARGNKSSVVRGDPGWMS